MNEYDCEKTLARRQRVKDILASLEELLDGCESSAEMQSIYGAIMSVRSAMIEEGLADQ